MKRTIIIEILLIATLGILFALNYYCWNYISEIIDLKDKIPQWTNEYYSMLKHHLPYAIFALFAILADVAAIILIAIKDFPIFKPIVDKFTAHKEKCAQAKAERAEEAKQAKIQALEAQLEELKKQ